MSWLKGEKGGVDKWSDEEEEEADDKGEVLLQFEFA